MATIKPRQQAQRSLFGEDEVDNTPAQPAVPRYNSGTIYELPVTSIHSDPIQPRKHFAEDSLEALAVTIRSHGIRQPVLFRLNAEGNIVLVAGERRWRAARMVGLKKIPALYVEGDHQEISLIENTQREDLTAIELAEALWHYKEQSNASLHDLAEIIGKAESTVSEIFSLNRLPEAVKKACRADRSVPRDILVEIAKAPTHEEMTRRFERYVQGTTPDRDQESATRVRPLKFSALSKHLTNYTARIASVDVATLKPAQRKKLKPLLQRAVDELSALLDNLGHE